MYIFLQSAYFMHPSKTSVVQYGIYSHINMQICLEYALFETRAKVETQFVARGRESKQEER